MCAKKFFWLPMKVGAMLVVGMFAMRIFAPNYGLTIKEVVKGANYTCLSQSRFVSKIIAIDE